MNIIVHPHLVERLRKEDEEILVQIERKCASRLTFSSAPTFHHEKFSTTDANTGAELKPRVSCACRVGSPECVDREFLQFVMKLASVLARRRVSGSDCRSKRVEVERHR